MDPGVLLSESVAYTREAFEGKWVRWLIFIILNLPMALFPFVFDTDTIMVGTTIHWELIHWDRVAAVVIAGILLSFVISGYLVRIYRGIQPAPDFDSWGDLFLDGIKLQVVTLLWILPALIVLVCFLGISIAGFASGSGDSLALFLVLLLLALLIGGVLLIVLSLFIPMAVIRFARTGSIGEGLRFSTIAEHIGKIGWVQYIVALIILVVVSLIAGIVLIALSWIPVAGWFISLVLTPLVTVFTARYYTLIYDQGGDQPKAA